MNSSFVDRCFGTNSSQNDSQCYERNFIMMFPFLLFWVTLPVQGLKLSTITERRRNFTRTVFLRIILFLVLLGNEVYDLFIHINSFDVKNWSNYAPYIFGITSLIFLLSTFIISVSRGHRRNGYIYSTLLLLFVVDLIIGIIDILDKQPAEIEKTMIIRVSVLSLINLLNCTNDTKADDLKINLSPEDHSTFYGRVFFSWMNKMIRVGSKKTLGMDDMYPLSSKNKSINLMEKFNAVWNELAEEHETRREHLIGDVHTPSAPSILTALNRMFRSSIAFGIGMRYLTNFLQFMNPILLTYLLNFVSEPSAPLSYGIAIVVTMFFIAETCSLLNNAYMYEMNQNACKVESVLSNAVFQKTLRLSASSRNRRTIGEMINYMAVDVHNISHFYFQLADAFGCPLQVILAMVFLYLTIGWVAIPGCVFVLIFVPLNYFSSPILKKYQTKQMKVKDERTKISSEILNGIKLIKLYAWEIPFEKRINGLRKEEVGHLVRMNFFSRVIDAANGSAPLFVTIITFTCYIYFSNEKALTPQIAFVCIAIINQMCIPMRIIAELIIFIVQALVSKKRLELFLNEEEMNDLKIEDAKPGYALQIENGTFIHSYGSERSADLKEINMNIRKGEFAAIVGTVGSGKSSVLEAIVGELYKISGSISYTGKIAYVPQQPWILNATLRKNILFGKEFNKNLYSKVISAAELTSDIEEMEFGDKTEIGENGVTLSGGQKARVSIARALYQEADIYLLDDCLSGVDAHVGDAVFKKAFSTDGFLREKTRILVTNGLHYTKNCDSIFVLSDRTFVEEGDYQSLLEHNGLFSELVRQREETERGRSDEMNELSKADVRKRSVKVPSSAPSASVSEAEASEAEEERRLIQQEKVETGSVKLNVYGVYIKAATYKWSLIFIGLHIIHLILTVLRALWMSKWTNEYDSSQKEDPYQRLAVYTGIGMVEVSSLMFTHFALVKCSKNASLRLHAPLLHSILRSPMKFFDTTAIGRILNRLSKDLVDVDVNLPRHVGYLFEVAANLIVIVTLISYSTLGFIIVVSPLALLSIYICYHVLPTTRQIRREESRQRSPILSHFGESIQGCSSIRAYRKVDETCRKFFSVNDEHVRCQYYLYATNRWIAVRLELIGCVVLLLAGLFAVLSTRFTGLSPGVVGMSISSALTLSRELFFIMVIFCNAETSAVAIERLDEYTHLEEEAEWKSPNPPPKQWPNYGQIEWKNYSTRYRSELPLILNNISASTNIAEKVGIVGRTGSGKSSLTFALFRLIEPAEGTIFIDGVDISKIGLHELRSRLTIIPQDPVLFSGPLRFNLDPFEEHSDEELWNALKECRLHEFTCSQPGKLDFEITSGGQNMSAGQRQLVCLGRALLKKGRILILDEATAACDTQTDSLVQQVIRDKFGLSTVLAIAHRLHTIENYDRILVLDNGKITEFDTPTTLLSNPESKYTKMVEKSKSQ